ncbi:MAG: tRNA 4-thiouridine(8) synthase ThiI [Candidatus Pacearchaeota archaeon]|nr:tRNA 4-thiouridine(8) synthase ThiI [Candidatus Pacearchaeota archaeon]
MKKKCLVLFSGGLDSRLAVKIMQEQGFDVACIYFKLPFGCSAYYDVEEFSKSENFKLDIFDCTKDELLQEYLDYLKSPKYGRGAGANPCKDCKIFMFRKAKEFADEKKIDLIVSGEVLGERPMSQMKSSLELIEKDSGLNGRILRPLSAKLFEETEFEKSGFVNRDNLYNIRGRKRDKQIELAQKFGISFPHPAGGCLLCEKFLQRRFEYLLKRGLSENEIELVKGGRHFVINDCWVILGRDKEENEKLERFGKNVGRLIVPDVSGPSALIIGKENVDDKVRELIEVYSKKGNIEERAGFDKYRL